MMTTVRYSSFLYGRKFVSDNPQIMLPIYCQVFFTLNHRDRKVHRPRRFNMRDPFAQCRDPVHMHRSGLQGIVFPKETQKTRVTTVRAKSSAPAAQKRFYQTVQHVRTKPANRTHQGGQQNHFPERRRFLVVDRKSTRLNSSHVKISYAVFCLKKKKK